jgi:hypothetical protein
MRAMDDEMSTMLAHSEDVNHIKLESSHDDLARYYKKGYGNIIKTIKASVKDVASLLLNIDDEDDISSFAEIFPFTSDDSKKIPTSDVSSGEDFDENEEDDETDKKDTKKLPEFESYDISPTKIVKIQKSKGIRVKANLKKDGIGGYFPMKLTLQLGYSKEGKRKALKSYHPFDFDLSSDESYISVEQKDVEIINKNKNIIEFKAQTKDFRLDIKNLLTDIYDLEVDLKNV